MHRTYICIHNYVMIWKLFPRYWSSVKGIHYWWPVVDSPNIGSTIRNLTVVVSLDRVLNKKSRCWWFETLLRRQYSGAYYDICTRLFCVHAFVDSCELLTYILPGCFVGTGTLTAWGNPILVTVPLGYHAWYRQTRAVTAKHSKAQTCAYVFNIPYMPATIWHQLYISVLHVYQLNGLHRCWSLVYTNNNFKHIFVSVCFNKLISLDNRVANCFLSSFMECHICNIFATWTLPFDLRYYTEFTVFCCS